MFGNLMGKLQDSQEDMKKRMDNILVDGIAGGGQVKVVCTGNKEIKQVWIDEDLVKSGDKDAIEELTVVAVNRALEKAGQIYEDEMKNMAKDLLPGMGSMFR